MNTVQVQHCLPSEKVQQNCYAPASVDDARHNGLQAMECTAGDFHFISRVEIRINHSHVASADDFAKLSNCIIGDNRPVIPKMNHFGYISRRLDSAQL